MAVPDISFVTRSLVNLIKESFNESSAWTAAQPPGVSPCSPEKLQAGEVGFYLYHVTEDGHLKNLPAPGQDQPPVRYVPMGLNLFYQLTAKGPSNDAMGTYGEQLRMSIAIKTLHDYPYINDKTLVNGVKVFVPELQDADNRIHIVLQPIAHNEAVTYWTAGTAPLQLSTYYQVSIVLLEPEKPVSRAGRVLTYGVHTFVGGGPRLDTTRNRLLFTIPGETDPREVELRPAQVPPTNQPPASVPVSSRIDFLGSDLTGDATSLLLKNILWDKPKSADPGWEVTPRQDSVSAVVRETINGERIFPGIFGAIIRVTRTSHLPSGATAQVQHTSNECPFTITPRVDSITGPVAGEWTVTGYIFTDPVPPPPPARPGVREIMVYIGNTILVEKTGVIGGGEFMVTTPSTLQFKVPAGLLPGEYPVRIFVNNAESPPHWITVV